MNHFETLQQSGTRALPLASRLESLRRQFLSLLFAASSLGISGFVGSPDGLSAEPPKQAEPTQPKQLAKPVDLRPSTAWEGPRRVRAVIQLEGKLKVNADGQGVRHVPLKGQAEWDYTQRVLAQAEQWLRVQLVRQYHTARSEMTLHRSPLSQALREERRLIVVDGRSDQAVLFSPQGSLTAEELDLIDGVAAGLALEALLPPRLILPGGQWTVRDAAVARLMGLEAVTTQDVTFTLQAVEEGVAIIALEGKVSGAVGGVSSDMELKGKMNYDLRRRLVTWLALAYREDRAIGHAQPGYEVVATVRMALAPVASSAGLSDQALAGLPLKADPATTLIEFSSPGGGFQIAHDRRWRVMLDRPDLTVLRLVDRGDLIAQCNIAPRPPLPAGQRLTLAAFQDDVRRALGRQFEQIVEAQEETDDSGLVVLRVLVAGVAGEIPIQWTYYHLSDVQGRCATLVFTLESSLIERFAALDRELIASFRFWDPPQPTPAGNAAPSGPQPTRSSPAALRPSEEESSRPPAAAPGLAPDVRDASRGGPKLR